MAAPPLEAIIDNLYPQSEGTLAFIASAGGQIIFKIVENKNSRLIGTGYDFVYDVFMDPPKSDGWDQGIFTDYIDNENASDEMIIGWQTWIFAGWTFFDLTLVKKWPPTCHRVGHNHYEVVIHYALLYALDFQISPTTVKRKFAIATQAWRFSNGDYYSVEVTSGGSATDLEKLLALLAIDTDSSGKIQGTDVIEPSFDWTERWTWGPNTYLTADGPHGLENYFAILTELSGTTNANSFRGCDPETVLFRRGAGRSTHPFTFEIDYNFSYKPLPPDGKQVFGPMRVEFPKSFPLSGWLYFDTEGQQDGIPVNILDREYKLEFPELIKVHRVYPCRDFSIMGLMPEITLGTGQPMKFAESLPILDSEALCPIPAIITRSL